jgi:hypothetical protein
MSGRCIVDFHQHQFVDSSVKGTVEMHNVHTFNSSSHRQTDAQTDYFWLQVSGISPMTSDDHQERRAPSQGITMAVFTGRCARAYQTGKDKGNPSLLSQQQSP